MYGVLLDRLRRAPLAGLGMQALGRLIMAIADTVDEAERKQSRGGPYGQRDNWKSASQLLHLYLRQLTGADRRRAYVRLFKNAKSIGWLMEGVIGKELFDHGRVGQPRAQPEDRLLTSTELDEAIELLSKRLRASDADRIADAPGLMSFLYRWKQSGGEKWMKRWVSKQINQDSQFLDLLDKCRGWRLSDRVRYPLNKRDISILMNFDSMKGRLKKISDDADVPGDLRSKARELLAAAALGEKDPDSE